MEGHIARNYPYPEKNKEACKMFPWHELTGMVVVENVPDAERDEVREEEVNSTDIALPRPSEVDDSSSSGEDRETSEAEGAETPLAA